jgi:hypothetical protein
LVEETRAEESVGRTVESTLAAKSGPPVRGKIPLADSLPSSAWTMLLRQ